MNNKGNTNKPVQQAEEACDKPILNSETCSIKKIRNKLLILLLPVFLAIPSGCSVMKSATLPSDNPSSQASNIKERQGNDEEEIDYYDEEDEKNEKWMKNMPGVKMPTSSKEFDIKRLKRDKAYYRKCHYHWKCDQA